MALSIQGGSDEHRKGSTPPESRAIGVTPPPQAGRAFTIPCQTPTSTRTRESSSIAPDYISPLKGYRLWQTAITIPNERRFEMRLDSLFVEYAGRIPAMPVSYRETSIAELWVTGERCEIPADTKVTVLSLNGAPIWQPRTVSTAICNCGSKQYHTCGFYATHNRNWLMRMYAEMRPNTISLSSFAVPEFNVYFTCGGSVWLWGDVAEHEEGYRAQYAYPAEFYYVRSCPQMTAYINYLASLYEVPAVDVTGQDYV